MSYRIVRWFADTLPRTVSTGLTLKEAQKWCRDPNNSSSTATDKEAIARTKLYGPWSDGYEKEK